ncbi:MAG: 4Fe-4S dicluster domain-containing protein [Candidatus Accumulibacter sp.]|nr:4Fe-4S dicluster domain-containing protein [Accumulibacter sp.]
MAGKYTIQLDFEACKACGYCRIVCRKHVYGQGSGFNKKGYRAFSALKADSCTGCLRCFYVCPDFCLEVIKLDGQAAI